MDSETEDRDAILNFTASMQEILSRMQGALQKNDIAERNAILELLQKGLEKMKVPAFRLY